MSDSQDLLPCPLFETRDFHGWRWLGWPLTTQNCEERWCEVCWLRQVPINGKWTNSGHKAALENCPSEPNVELKSCPFCGGDAIIRLEDQVETPDDEWWYVDCAACPIQTYPQITKAEAARIWNTRSPSVASTTQQDETELGK